MTSSNTLYISKEIKELRKGPELSLIVRAKDEDVRRCRAIILGPPDTPYSEGFFEFSIKFGREYPNRSPEVRLVTTNGGRTRFNPNLYADGKVCLSILGTWRAEKNEEWSSAHGLETLLISIQSLMSSNPYENEPGFEDDHTDGQKKEAKAYIAKITHETIRIAVCSRLEEVLCLAGPLRREGEATSEASESKDDLTDDEDGGPFDDFLKSRFLWYHHSYLETIEKTSNLPEGGSGRKPGSAFTYVQFEDHHNEMAGSFNWPDLNVRIKKIHTAINDETAQWKTQGLQELQRESPKAHNFQTNFLRISSEYRKSHTSIELELCDGNPFSWNLTLFGRPMTNLDGGIFNIQIVFSPDFPTKQPRVHVVTPIFHQRVSPNGTLCYTPEKPEEIISHIEAIVAAFEDESPPYDPRLRVNPEASRLFWGSADDKKIYNRKLRRSAQDSSEAC